MSERTPRETHAIEQTLAGAATIGGALAKMYLAMVAEGVPPSHAVQIVASYGNAMAQPQPPREP